MLLLLRGPAQQYRSIALALTLVFCVASPPQGFGKAASINVIADTPSAFAQPDPSSPKFVVTLAGHKSASVPTGDAAGALPPAAGGGQGAHAAGLGSPAADPRVRIMTDARGVRYACSLVDLEAVAAAQKEHELQLAAALTTKSPFELLEAMSALCLYRKEDIWTYEVCYRKHARQFRQESSNRNEDNSCGSYVGDEEQDDAIQEDSSATAVPIRYVSHHFRGGAKCVMTGEQRSAEVRFTCMPDTPDNTIVSVKEFPTCHYVFVVSTPFLCKHPAFRPPPEKHAGIRCEPLSTGAGGAGPVAAGQGATAHNPGADRMAAEAPPAPSPARGAAGQADSGDEVGASSTQPGPSELRTDSRQQAGSGVAQDGGEACSGEEADEEGEADDLYGDDEGDEDDEAEDGDEGMHVVGQEDGEVGHEEGEEGGDEGDEYDDGEGEQEGGSCQGHADTEMEEEAEGTLREPAGHEEL